MVPDANPGDGSARDTRKRHYNTQVNGVRNTEASAH
jgi:hypothetical protein